jgi:hypothetical protein
MLSDIHQIVRLGEAVKGTPWANFLSTNTENILIEIGHELKESTAFRDLYDLAQFLWDSFTDALTSSEQEKLDVSRIAAQIIERLGSPLRRFSFQVPLSPHSDLRFSLEIGGEHALKIECVGADMNDAMLVSGQVDAATEPSAIVAVEDLVAALLGAFRFWIFA